LRRGLGDVLANNDVTGQVLGDGPLAQVAFTGADPVDYRSSRHENPKLARRVMLNLFAGGMFINPMSTKFYLSLAHTEADCDEFLAAFNEALATALVAELASQR
jgi:glutamate-1-semialdehyde 2,1-aminomutase